MSRNLSTLASLAAVASSYTSDGTPAGRHRGSKKPKSAKVKASIASKRRAKQARKANRGMRR